MTFVLVLAPGAARAADPTATPPLEAAASETAGPHDPLEPLRGRFRDGMEKYRTGAFAEAIVIWESIYRELGAEKGYRVAFDLARAYDALGEAIKAAEHYQSYLDRVAARRRDGEALEPNVENQEEAAQDRLERLATSFGRIRVETGGRPMIVHVDNAPATIGDFVVFVEPGEHVVTFGTGTSRGVRTVAVARGEIAHVEPPPERPVPVPSPIARQTTEIHPFSPALLWISGGAALVSVVLPVVTYANALSIKSDYDNPAKTAPEKVRFATEYDSARATAYASLLVPAILFATAGTLAGWYVLGTRESRPAVAVRPSASFTPTSASIGLGAAF